MTSWIVLGVLGVSTSLASAQPATPQAVIEQLERENAKIAKNYRRGVPSSEDYAEWYGSVLQTAFKLLPRLTPETRPRLIAALVNAAYNDDSQFANGWRRWHNQTRTKNRATRRSEGARPRPSGSWNIHAS